MKKRHTYIEKIPRLILRIGLPFIVIILIYILHYIQNINDGEAITMYRIAVSMLENAMMTLTLIIGAALLLDYSIKKDKN